MAQRSESRAKLAWAMPSKQAILKQSFIRTRAIHNSQLTIHNWQFTIHNWQFTIHESQIIILHRHHVNENILSLSPTAQKKLARSVSKVCPMGQIITSATPDSSNIRGYFITYPWIFHYVSAVISLNIRGYFNFWIFRTDFSCIYIVTLRREDEGKEGLP